VNRAPLMMLISTVRIDGFNAETFVTMIYLATWMPKGKDNENATANGRDHLSRPLRLASISTGDFALWLQGGEENKKPPFTVPEVHCTAYQYTIALTQKASKKSQNGRFSRT